ncbi:MAG TPA: class I SAM-dependent methyltransferase [Terriglobales bacterium]|nr:class I SAM-dependent methyltransferase [Terriglobales bacterium]
MKTVREHDWRWKADGGYYTNSAVELRDNPLLPDFRKLRDRKFAALFERFVPAPGGEALELGCGASRWLPYLALRKQCRVTGVDYEPSAVELTEANMRGAGAAGTILCRDAFDLKANDDLVGRFDLVYSLGLLEHFDDLAHCLRAVTAYACPGGLVMTMVPNLQGVNWALQRYGDIRILETHVVYDVGRLRRRHEEAGLTTLAAGYAGFYDGFVSATAPSTPRGRRKIHHAICRTTNMAARAWLLATRERVAPELAWTAPAVYYVGRRA